MNKIDLMHMPLSTGSYNEFVSSLIDAAKERRSQYTCVANVHMWIEAYRDKQFSGVVANADYITPDGKPLSWALKMLYGIKQDRVAGMDLLPDLLQGAIVQDLPVCFYGGSLELLDKTREFIDINYPELNVVGMISPPYRNLSATETEWIIKDINESGAAMVFVILGCPKQEKWMASMAGKINSLMIGIGGALPVMVGMQKRAPRWMQDAGLEWAYRLSLEPKRLVRRYMVTNSMFLYLLTRKYISLKLNRVESPSVVKPSV